MIVTAQHLFNQNKSFWLVSIRSIDLNSCTVDLLGTAVIGHTHLCCDTKLALVIFLISILSILHNVRSGLCAHCFSFLHGTHTNTHAHIPNLITTGEYYTALILSNEILVCGFTVYLDYGFVKSISMSVVLYFLLCIKAKFVTNW